MGQTGNAAASPPLTAGAAGSSSPAAADDASSSPAQAVREGNRLLNAGDINAALQQYRRVLDEHPDAREVAFNLGLAQFAAGDYQAARKAFDEASLAEDSELAADALYGLAACDHAEGLSLAGSDPKAALGKTQEALKQYRDVLRQTPGHAGAGESRLKAAALWKQIKEVLEQQPPPQQSQDSQQPQDEPDDEQNQNQQQQQQQQTGDQQQSQDQQAAEGEQPQESPPESQPQGELEEPQPSPPTEEAQEQGEQEQLSQALDEEEPQAEDEQEEAPPDENEAEAAPSNELQQDPTREEALRQLRRLMDRQRLNQRQRRQPVPPPAVRPVEKDW